MDRARQCDCWERSWGAGQEWASVSMVSRGTRGKTEGQEGAVRRMVGKRRMGVERRGKTGGGRKKWGEEKIGVDKGGAGG